jgi:GcrA cell cycle regulator
VEAIMSDPAVSWTDERVELLKRLWSEGLSASQIAAEMGGVTRNAVIGKVHRLGLSGRGKSPPPAANAAAKPRPKPPQAAPAQADGNAALATAPEPRPAEAPRPEPQTSPAVVVPISERVTIMELRESMCRWPIGDPTSSEFRFCGARSITGLPYCTHHAEIAYQPVADRRRDRRLAGRV